MDRSDAITTLTKYKEAKMESEGKRLSEIVNGKTKEFRSLCQNLDEQTASRAPEGRWSPKQIVSHLCGPEGVDPVARFRLFLEQDTPTLEITPGNPYFSEARGRMTFAQLLSEFDNSYRALADFAGGLSAEQLSRKARIPVMKDTPLGEYQSLGEWIRGVAEYHITFHIDHMREILQNLGVLRSA